MKVLYLSILYSIKKAFTYRANLIAWFLADISLVSSSVMTYYLLTLSISNFGGYSSKEMIIYITTFFVVNNIFAIFFAEGISHFVSSILNGTYEYIMLLPKSRILAPIYKKINFPPLLMTPLLLIFNFILIDDYLWTNILLYYLSIIFSAMTMGLLFYLIYSLSLMNLRIEFLNEIIMQLLSLGERPDTIFPRFFRNFLTYFLPVFMFSAIPTKILIGNLPLFSLIIIIIIFILYLLLLKCSLKLGYKKYKPGVQ